MPQVFISYAWEDGASTARWLYDRFNRLQGWSAWMDRDLHADTMFSTELQHQINRADMIVAVITPGANRLNPPSFVQRELGYATQPEVGKPVYAVKAIPTMIPLIIWGVTYVEFIDATAYEAAFASLIARISGAVLTRTTTPRQREEAYLRELARDDINRRAAKFYAEMPAQAAEKAILAEPRLMIDPEAAAMLAELAADIHTRPHHSPDDDPQARRVQDFAQLSDALARYPRAAIIGDPGSGKTTTLRRLAFRLAESAAHDEAAPLPVFVPLGGYTGGDFEAHIDAHFGGLRVRDYLPGRPERLIMLLDGLNETAAANVPAIEAWLKRHPAVRVRLTCRKLDYVERALPLQRIDVLPLDHLRIRAFIAAYGVADDAADRLFWKLAGEALRAIWLQFTAKKLTLDDFFNGQPLASGHPVYSSTNLEQDRLYNQMRAGDGYPGLLGLARNPFLLTIILSIFVSQGDVPPNRAGLFAAFVHRLFADRGRPAAQQQGLVWLDETILRAGLTALAYAMQRDERGTRMPYEWARDIVAAALPGHDAAQVLYLAASAGILDRGGDLRFAHQLLQEYFAAAGMGEDLRRGVLATRYFPSDAWWMPTGWEETALLLAGMDGDATQVVAWLTPTQPDLAYRAATESGAPCSPAVLRALYQPAPGARRSPRAVAEWGRLNHAHDDRPGVGLRPDGVPDIDWVRIAGGEFIYQDDQRITLPPFRISRYLVTYAQFQTFIDAPDGWSNPIWWEGLSASDEHKAQPGDQAFKFNNHPRERVSWYDAIAFTRWLSARLDTAITLPSEQQYERAARWTDGRAYPYSGAYDARKANTADTGIGQTSAVGSFPDGASVEGVHDLSGNVWEWCLNKYRSPDDASLGGTDTRVERGGSWDFDQYFARAAFRHFYYPYGRNLNFGFRLVLSSPI